MQIEMIRKLKEMQKHLNNDISVIYKGSEEWHLKCIQNGLNKQDINA